ncbi:MAG: Holliday junction resolvase RuvX [Cyanobacteria bacterium P01_F01_bin.42]
MCALGLDLGERRIGVAGCDRLGLIASGLTTIHRRSFSEDMELLSQIIRDRDVTLLVIGLPYTLEGKIGYQAKRVQRLAQRISDAVNLPVEFIDERLTSHEAKQLIQQQRRRANRDRGAVDRMAAALILQQWLNQNQNRNPQDQSSHAKISLDS